jgi:hypothetical protein
MEYAKEGNLHVIIYSTQSKIQKKIRDKTKFK